MRVTKQIVKEFLLSSALYGTISRERLENYLTLYDRATKVTSHLTGMPSGGGSDRNALLANLADSFNNASDWVSRVAERRDLVVRFLDAAPLEELDRFVLKARYVQRKKWTEILFLCNQKQKLSERNLFYIHNRALSECASWVNKTGRFRDEILDIS